MNKPAKGRRMTVAGVMSGTSADGIDVAIVRILPVGERNRITLLAHEAFPFSAAMRAAVLAAMNVAAASVADLSRLGTRLGIAYAEAIAAALAKHSLQADLIGCHGQTIYHQGASHRYLGKNLATTWQMLDPSPITERLRIPVVSDFRPADIAAGGQGAPLVPLLDYEFFRSKRQHRVLQNLGGIGNMTVLPAAVAASSVIAFDTGPANMVIDALMLALCGKQFDRNGAFAARGSAIVPVVDATLSMPFFRKPAPKTAGREQFGTLFVTDFLRKCRSYSSRPEDAVATATLLTAASIRLALEQFAVPAIAGERIQLIASGGGTRNAMLMRMLQDQTAAANCTVLTSDDLGLPSAAKEAVAFALLAWNTWHRLPGNLPSATGAARPTVLGRVSYV